jgi:hypothetical protein
MRYLVMLIMLSFIICPNSDAREKIKWIHDSKLEMKITYEVDRICNILGLKRQDDIKYRGYINQNGYKAYLGNVKILFKKKSLNYMLVFFISDGKIILRSFMPYNRDAPSENKTNSILLESIKQKIFDAISIFTNKVMVTYYEKSEMFETQNYYYVKYNTHEQVIDPIVTFIFTKDIKLIGIYYGA